MTYYASGDFRAICNLVKVFIFFFYKFEGLCLCKLFIKFDSKPVMDLMVMAA